MLISSNRSSICCTVDIPLQRARGPVVGMRSGGRGMRLPAARPMLPALDTRGALTLASTTVLDDVTLAEIGRVMRDTPSVYTCYILYMDTHTTHTSVKEAGCMGHTHSIGSNDKQESINVSAMFQ